MKWRYVSLKIHSYWENFVTTSYTREVRWSIVFDDVLLKLVMDILLSFSMKYCIFSTLATENSKGFYINKLIKQLDIMMCFTKLDNWWWLLSTSISFDGSWFKSKSKWNDLFHAKSTYSTMEYSTLSIFFLSNHTPQ
jgi:uncharacterized pyridoxamine 5'-phosphate oxidase family protein